MGKSLTVETSSEQWQWGVCGFVSVLSALQDQKVIDLGHYEANSTEHRDLVISLVKDFLRQLQQEKPCIAKDVEAFTQTFGGDFKKQTLQGFLQHEHGCAPASDAKIGIALTPDAVVEFLHYIKRAAGRLDSPTGGTGGPCIIGLGTQDNTRWKGLRHWVFYKSDAEVYTWGQKHKLADLVPGRYTGILYKVAL